MNKFILVRNKIKDFTFFIGGKLKIFFAALWKLMKNHKIWSAVICIVLALVLFIGISTVRLGKKLEDSNLLIKVEKRDIEEKINDSTVVEPNNEYSITANVTGEILDDPFEEGDTVQKGDLMYTIDASTIENSIQSADIRNSCYQKQKERRQSRKRFIFYFFLQLIGKQFIVLSVDFCQRFQFSYGGNL